MDWIYIILIIMIFIFLMVIIIYLYFLMRKYKIDIIKKDKSYELILSDMVNMILNKKINVTENQNNSKVKANRILRILDAIE